MNNDEGRRLFATARACFAPMAGYSDAPTRLICFEFGADFAYTEMVSAEGLIRNGERTRRILERMEGEGPVGVQLFGADPASLARAAAAAAATGPAFIDLNFGCPVRKVVRKNGGVAIMRDPDLMRRICEGVVAEVDLPVTAKIRSGWSSAEENYMEVGFALQAAGVTAVALHPRHKTQGFSGSANWEHIARLREALDITVIANGDVGSAADYLAMVEATGCRIVMIGRGACGRPWIFEEIRNVLAGVPASPLQFLQMIDIMERHVHMEIGWKGERGGIIEMRKQYGWYLKGMSDARRYRRELASAENLDEVTGILRELKEGYN